MGADLLSAIAAGLDVTLSISARDLREVVAEIMRSERERAAMELKAESERAYLKRTEAMALLGASASTMTRWAADGYLVPVKVGRKSLYRASDVDRILTGKSPRP